RRFPMTALQRSLLSAGVALGLAASAATAQGVERVRASLLRQVVPEADRFDPAEGQPPVKRAYRGDELVGYVFLTSDLPPEERGYSGPIESLVGMAPDGTLIGVRVTEYHETYMRTKGDFLRTPGFQEQFSGKYIGDAFRVYEDVDGIARVSISIRAMARAVRNSARRVAAAYPPTVPRPVEAVGEVTSLSWFDMRARGVAARMDVTGEGEDPVGISLLHLESEELARYLLGGLYQYVLNAVERRGGADQMILYVVDGAGSRMAVQQGWSIVQNGATTSIPVDDVVMLGSPWEGLLAGETSLVGVLMLDDDAVDVGAPLSFSFARGADRTYTVDYTSQRALAVMAAAVSAGGADTAAREGAAAESVAGPSGSAGAGGDDEEPSDASASPVEAGAAAAAAVSAPAAPAAPAAEPLARAPAAAPPPVEQLVQLDFSEVREETALERLLANTSWSRVGWILLVLVLASAAFFTKRTVLRWISLATTFTVLGFVDGGFLSVSHITGIIWVGPSAVLGDLPLLLMVAFTVVAVLVWGRIFCGFLCPFGALQDFIDRLVPARFKRELPRRVHRGALKAKYGVLAVILLPALAGSEASIYQFFEPFGTVFFLSTDVVLWAIAGVILIASVVVPRFYCRYACPLGAALALGSTLSLRRIARVEQCDYCKVCEAKCPTGAIDGPSIDFKECVRCNVCEVQLIQRTGVCRHDMEAIRPRLVQLKTRAAARAAEPVA
ncbi:MAG TPA: 4Fe-4S binding protein, partial [Longimicrobiales bacterium]|nr:4Fe-4S binding protein [Longimicrobiales bacterium]